MVHKHYYLKFVFLFLPLVLFCISCSTIRENGYVNMSYEDLARKRGTPTYTINQIIEKNHLRYDFEPVFEDHFSEAELEESVVVKYASWKKTHSALMVWFKNIDETWISFSSTEYRGPFLR